MMVTLPLSTPRRNRWPSRHDHPFPSTITGAICACLSACWYPDVGVQLLAAPVTERRRPGIDWLYRSAVCLLQPIFYVTKVVKHVQSSRPAKDLWVGLNRYHLTVTRRLMGIPPC